MAKKLFIALPLLALILSISLQPVVTQAAVPHALVKSAERGSVEAQYTLGSLYATGQGVVQDYKQAAQWYSKAAAKGHVWAQTNLGYLYDKGLGVTQDYSQAFKWYQKAAWQGDTTAQSNLGDLYYRGEGVPQNYEEAYFWFTISSSMGDDAAAAARDAIADQLPRDVLSDTQKRAAAWNSENPKNPAQPKIPKKPT
jgi:TPR repeat protein